MLAALCVIWEICMNNEETLTGSCLCGECKYSITSELKHFLQCHCIQCRKTTSSAFAANIIAVPTEIKWVSGEGNTKRFDYPGRGFTQVFCKTCGSGLPFIDGGGEMLFIPTGTLDNAPSIKPEANIFWGERAGWCEHGIAAPKHERFENT
jgi:hypothetical protein